MKKVCLILVTIFIWFKTFAQNAKDTTVGGFQDDLLNHLVGKWTVSGVVHGIPFNNLHLTAKWIMNHQYLQIHEKGTDTVPFIKMPWEAMFLIGYNHNSKRYVFYELTVRGIDEPYEGFSYATRLGNILKVSSKISPVEIINQYFIWQPTSRSWHLVTRLEKAGKEGVVYLDLKAIAEQ